MFESLEALYKRTRQFSPDNKNRLLVEAKELVRSGEATPDVQCLFCLLSAREAQDAGKFDSALEILGQAKALFESEQTQEWQPDLLRMYAAIFQMQGRRQEAFELLVKAYTSPNAVDNHWILGQISLSLGIISANSGDYDGASLYLQRCLEHSALGKVNLTIQAQAHLILAQAQLERGALDEALHHATESLKAYQALQLPNAVVAASLLASVHIERKNIEAARIVLSEINFVGLSPIQRISIFNLNAKLHSIDRRNALAIQEHDAAIELATEIGDARLSINSAQLKCETLLGQSQFMDALELLDRYKPQVGRGYDLLTYNELRARALEGLGRLAEALEEHKAFSLLQKELLSERASNALSRLRAAQEVLEAEREAAHFRERSQFYAKELSQRTSYLVQQNEYVNNVIDHIQTLSRQRPEAAEFLKDIRQRLRELPAASFDWNEYLRLFDEIHPNALTVLKKQYPDLSPTESKICSLVLAKLSNIDIARLLGSSERTVENHRHRLRKKLGLAAGIDLTAFLERTLAERPNTKPEAASTLTAQYKKPG